MDEYKTTKVMEGIPSEQELYKNASFNKKENRDNMDDVQKLQQQYILKSFKIC
jgi:hypothetical protein